MQLHVGLISSVAKSAFAFSAGRGGGGHCNRKLFYRIYLNEYSVITAHGRRSGHHEVLRPYAYISDIGAFYINCFTDL